MPKHKVTKRQQLLALVSPFAVPSFRIRIRKLIPKGLFREKTEGKKDFEPYEKELHREQDKFIRMYTSRERQKVKAQLSSKACHLLMWILEEIRGGEDFVVISTKNYIKDSQRLDSKGKLTNISINTYKEAINDLVDKAIIAKTSKHETYFINPSYFFNGSRPKKYPNNIDFI